MREEYGDKGLVVIALSNEADQLVSDYIDQNGLTLPIGAGSTSSPRYGVSGIPSSALIDPQGKVAWTGHPSSLSKSTIEAALKGARPRPANFLAFTPATATDGRLSPIGKSMASGKLGAALKAANTLTDDAKATAEEKSGAESLAVEIREHADLLTKQAEGFVKSLDVVSALKVFDALADELPGVSQGDAAKERAAQIRKDEKLSKELAAAEAFEKTKSAVAKLASAKAKAKWQEFAEKWEGTRAGDRAKAISRGPAKK